MWESSNPSTTLDAFQSNPALLARAPVQWHRVLREVMLVMRAYELMVIFDADVAEDGVAAQLVEIDRQVQVAGGRIATTDNWGRRRFAYEINHKNEGTYVVLEIVTEGGDLHDLERSLRLADEVVRHKVIRLPDHEAAKRGLVEAASPAEAG